ncbi:MAG: hypothetical protein KF729_20795 [Sandaracinaceae bacterium]|nr:hypothetical protein [Sandaracinaceae bacterium]
MRRSLSVTVLLLGLAGCPSGRPAPAEACAEVGARCRTPEGPLGVCIETDPCEAPPCLRCAPQH